MSGWKLFCHLFKCFVHLSIHIFRQYVDKSADCSSRLEVLLALEKPSVDCPAAVEKEEKDFTSPHRSLGKANDQFRLADRRTVNSVNLCSIGLLFRHFWKISNVHQAVERIYMKEKPTNYLVNSPIKGGKKKNIQQPTKFNKTQQTPCKNP